MVKVSHNNVVIHVFVLKDTSTIVLIGLQTFTMGEECTVPLSLFADPERILRRLYVFAEEPCKSNTATSEPCSPVFKEAQPRPSSQKNIEEHSNLEYHVNNLNLYLYVFGLFII